MLFPPSLVASPFPSTLHSLSRSFHLFSLPLPALYICLVTLLSRPFLSLHLPCPLLPLTPLFFFPFSVIRLFLSMSTVFMLYCLLFISRYLPPPPLWILFTLPFPSLSLTYFSSPTLIFYPLVCYHSLLRSLHIFFSWGLHSTPTFAFCTSSAFVCFLSRSLFASCSFPSVFLLFSYISPPSLSPSFD